MKRHRWVCATDKTTAVAMQRLGFIIDRRRVGDHGDGERDLESLAAEKAGGEVWLTHQFGLPARRRCIT
jgi:hypothetical protein